MREDAAQDLLLTLWSEDLPNHDPAIAPLEVFLRVAARRHVRKYLKRDLARYRRRQAAETQAASQGADRQEISPAVVLTLREAIRDVSAASARIKTHGFQDELLKLVIQNPHEQLQRLAAQAGYKHKSSASRALARVRERMQKATRNPREGC